MIIIINNRYGALLHFRTHHIVQVFTRFLQIQVSTKHLNRFCTAISTSCQSTLWRSLEFQIHFSLAFSSSCGGSSDRSAHRRNISQSCWIRCQMRGARGDLANTFTSCYYLVTQISSQLLKWVWTLLSLSNTCHRTSESAALACRTAAAADLWSAPRRRRFSSTRNVSALPNCLITPLFPNVNTVPHHAVNAHKRNWYELILDAGEQVLVPAELNAHLRIKRTQVLNR
jgi:hypothetical protein